MWRWAGVGAAVFVYSLAVVSFGIGLVLAPASFGVSVFALRKLEAPRGALPWIGFALNVVVLLIAGYIGLIAALGRLPAS